MAKGYNTLQKGACIRGCDTTQKNFTDSNFCELEERKHRTNHKNTKLLDIPKIAAGRMSEDDETGATKILSSDETLLEASEAIKKKLMKKHSPPHSATALPDPPKSNSPPLLKNIHQGQHQIIQKRFCSRS